MTRENNAKPSASPSSPSAKFISDALMVYRLRQVEEKTIADAGKIAEYVFEILGRADDYAVLTGEIDPEIAKEIKLTDDEISDKDLKSYIKIINGLFILANDSTIGATKNLDRDIVKNFAIDVAARAQCLGGGELLDVLCDIVNLELGERRPNVSPKSRGTTSVAALDGHSHVNGNPISVH